MQCTTFLGRYNERELYGVLLEQSEWPAGRVVESMCAALLHAPLTRPLLSSLSTAGALWWEWR
jgi:hypothetical protein